MRTHPDISPSLAALADVCAFASRGPLYKGLAVPRTIEEFLQLPEHDRAFLLQNSSHLSHAPEEKIRYLASEFDPSRTETLFLVPQEVDRVWDSLGKELAQHTPKVLMCLLPLFWQVGPMFYHTARLHKTPVTVVPPHNLPLAAQVFEEAEVEAIVATDAVAQEFQPLLMERGLAHRVKFWHIVSPLALEPSFRGKNVYAEKHLFPGVPVAFQDDATASSSNYLPSPRYFFEFGDTTCITSMMPEALTLIRYTLDVALVLEDGPHGPTLRCKA